MRSGVGGGSFREGQYLKTCKGKTKVESTGDRKVYVGLGVWLGRGGKESGRGLTKIQVYNDKHDFPPVEWASNPIWKQMVTPTEVTYSCTGGHILPGRLVCGGMQGLLFLP